MVTPDLKVTNRAIRNHLAEHKQEGDGSDRLDSLEQFLAEQVLIVASKINLQTIGEGRLPVNKNPKYPKGTKGHEAAP